MQSTERHLRVWSLVCAVVVLNLPAAANATTAANLPLNRQTCLVEGNWYGFYRSKRGLIPVCLKLPEAISVKMLDSNDDGVVDNADTLSSGVVFIGESPTGNPSDSDATVNDSSGGDSPVVEKSGGGSRRIMWRQIQ